MTKRTLCSILFLSLSLRADSWSLLHDNDTFFDSDDFYSAGVQISWVSDDFDKIDKKGFSASYINLFSTLIENLGVSFDGQKRAGGISLQELIVTPNDLEQSQPIYNDVPYTGLLSGSFSLLSWDDNKINEYSLIIGLIGPSSGAEELQTTTHKIVGATDPQGWHNQLSSKMILQIGCMQGFKHYIQNFENSQKLEWLNSYYVDVGNFYTGAGAGSAIHFGKNFPSNFPNTTGLLFGGKGNMVELNRKNNAFGWDIHGGVFCNVVGYFYLYKESERLGYDFDHPHLLPAINVGATFYWNQWNLGLDVFPSGSTATDPRDASFARISLTWNY